MKSYNVFMLHITVVLTSFPQNRIEIGRLVDLPKFLPAKISFLKAGNKLVRMKNNYSYAQNYIV